MFLWLQCNVRRTGPCGCTCNPWSFSLKRLQRTWVSILENWDTHQIELASDKMPLLEEVSIRKGDVMSEGQSPGVGVHCRKALLQLWRMRWTLRAWALELTLRKKPLLGRAERWWAAATRTYSQKAVWWQRQPSKEKMHSILGGSVAPGSPPTTSCLKATALAQGLPVLEGADMCNPQQVMETLKGYRRPDLSLLALMPVACEVLGESVPFEKALDNVDKINSNGYFCWEGPGLQARWAQVPTQICSPLSPECLLLGRIVIGLHLIEDRSKSNWYTGMKMATWPETFSFVCKNNLIF